MHAQPCIHPLAEANARPHSLTLSLSLSLSLTHTHTHTQKHVIFIARPLQQLFSERALMLCYTYIAPRLFNLKLHEALEI
jgi:hypothetical protein